MGDWFTRRGVLGATAASIATVGGGYYFLDIGKGNGVKTPQCGTAPPADLDAPTIGNADAAVTVAAYSDFSCPHCRDYALNVLPKIRHDFVQAGQVRYEHHAFPLPVNKWSRPAANAAREVQRRASDTAFFEYATALYRHQDSYSYDLFNQLASTVNVPGKPVEQAARNGAYCAVLNESIQQGLERGVSGTPTVFVNDRKLTAPSAKKLSGAIEQARS
jgi:protein-disulfide isomerase